MTPPAAERLAARAFGPAERAEPRHYSIAQGPGTPRRGSSKGGNKYPPAHHGILAVAKPAEQRPF
ncbi:hypothetical protein GWP57_02780 [Gammaproteobacteria bacterium]|nr:hypothetical protein [Gammaproteobacteria bacterium]